MRKDDSLDIFNVETMKGFLKRLEECKRKQHLKYNRNVEEMTCLLGPLFDLLKDNHVKSVQEIFILWLMDMVTCLLKDRNFYKKKLIKYKRMEVQEGYEDCDNHEYDDEADYLNRLGD